MIGSVAHKLVLLTIALISLVHGTGADYDYHIYDVNSDDPSQNEENYILAIMSILNGKYTLSPYGFLSVDVGELAVIKFPHVHDTSQLKSESGSG